MQHAADVQQLTTPAPTAPVLTIEEQTTKALQALASYFAAQFVLTAPESTWTGKYNPLNLFWAPPKFQGLSSRELIFDKAFDSFNMARSALLSVDVKNFDEKAKLLLSKTLNELKTVSPGSRFHQAMIEWLTIFDQASLSDTKTFITQCQMIFKESNVSVEITQQGTSPSVTPLATIDNGAEAIHFCPSNNTAPEAFIRGITFRSPFEAMQAVPSIYNKERPDGMKSALPMEVIMAKLLSNTVLQPKPSENQAFETIEHLLTLYPKMFKAVYDAALDSGETVDLKNFTLHCALMETLLLTIADRIDSGNQVQDEKSRKATADKHWSAPASKEIEDLLKDLSQQLKNQRGRISGSHLDFPQATAALANLVTTIDSKTTVLEKDDFIAVARSFLKAEEGSAEKLLALFIKYIEALGALLSKEIHTYSNHAAINDKLNPILAKEVIESMTKYVLSDAFKAGLNIKETPAAAASSSSSAAAAAAASIIAVTSPTTPAAAASLESGAEHRQAESLPTSTASSSTTRSPGPHHSALPEADLTASAAAAAASSSSSAATTAGLAFTRNPRITHVHDAKKKDNPKPQGK